MLFFTFIIASSNHHLVQQNLLQRHICRDRYKQNFESVMTNKLYGDHNKENIVINMSQSGGLFYIFMSVLNLIHRIMLWLRLICINMLIIICVFFFTFITGFSNQHIVENNSLQTRKRGRPPKYILSSGNMIYLFIM